VSRRWSTTVASSELDSPRFASSGRDDHAARSVRDHGSCWRVRPGSAVVIRGGRRGAAVPAVEITAADGGREVRPSDVHSVHVEHVLERVYSRVGLAVHDGNGLEQSWSGTLGGEGVLPAVRAARKGRPRTMTPALLAEVAAIYREHVDGTPSAKIARRFSVSDRTARLYVQRAREAGLLGGSIPGRAGEAKGSCDGEHPQAR
jgi:hypothetical protein